MNSRAPGMPTAPPAAATANAPRVTTTASIDDLLGPAASRFFGDGHRRVEYRFTCVEAEPGTERGITARAAVICPPDWSLKGARAQVPHLSTIDALIAGGRMAELLLTREHRLSGAQLAQAWLRRVEIRAGKAPDEENLERLQVSARLTGTRPYDGAGGTAVSALACRIGSMRLRCEVVHPVLPAPPAGDCEIDPVTLSWLPLGLYGEGFRRRRQPLTDVTVDTGRQQATAAARLVPVPGARPVTAGLEAAYQPAVGFVDAFVVTLQMGQALLYALDGLDRARSNTLWMRRTVLECETPNRPAAGPFPVLTALVDSTLLDARDGTRWRTADITGDCAGVRVICSVTHELPRPAASTG